MSPSSDATRLSAAARPPGLFRAWLWRSPREVLLLAAILWTVVGATLLVMGAVWAVRAGSAGTAWLLPVAVAAGVLKGGWILRRLARRIRQRVLRRGARQWIGGFMPLGLWLAIAAMIISGHLMRRYVLPRDVAGLVYLAVGLALLLGAAYLWRGWHGLRPDIVTPETG